MKQPIFTPMKIGGAAIAVAIVCAIVVFEHRHENSLIGEWKGKPNTEILTAFSSLSGMPKLSYTADIWQFDPSGKAVDTVSAVDSQGRAVSDTTVGTYVAYGDDLVVTYAMVVHSDSAGRKVSALNGSMITRYRISSDRLIFLPTTSDYNTAQYQRVQ